eukprot:397398-Rhodomonas_salina.1
MARRLRHQAAPAPASVRCAAMLRRTRCGASAASARPTADRHPQCRRLVRGGRAGTRAVWSVGVGAGRPK